MKNHRYDVMPSLAARATSAAWWSTLEILARYGVQFLVMVVLARLLTPGDFGLIAMLLVFTSIGTLLVDSGFGAALIQRQHTTVDDETTVFIFTLCIGIVTAGILVLTAPAIAAFFNQPKLVDLTRVMALVLPLGAFAAVPDALLTMRLNFKARARAEVVASLCSGAVAVILALRGFGVWSLAWQSIVSIGVRGLLLWVYSGWRPQGRYRGTSFRSLFGFGGYMLLTGLLNAAAGRLQSLWIGKLFDASTLGLYTIAQNTQQAPASLIDGILKRVGLPVFSTIAQDQAKLRSAFRTSLRMVMFLFFPCMVGIALVAKPLIELLYGTRWVPAAPILSILSLSAALWPIHVLNLAAIGAQGRSDLLLRVEVVKQLASIILITASAHWGPIAIAWAVFVSGFFGVAVNAYYSKKLLGYGALMQLLDQTATFALSLVAAGVGWVILHWTRPGPIPMLGAIAAAAAMYVLLAILTRNAALSGLLSVVQTLRNKSKGAAIL
ncbi:hypothetical protein B0E46_09190 [Rhodanobacter sp. B04]|nr:hypothetical protein B0E46_09190 [Rhodanobacter sp. B04]